MEIDQERIRVAIPTIKKGSAEIRQTKAELRDVLNSARGNRDIRALRFSMEPTGTVYVWSGDHEHERVHQTGYRNGLYGYVHMDGNKPRIEISNEYALFEQKRVSELLLGEKAPTFDFQRLNDSVRNAVSHKIDQFLATVPRKKPIDN